MDNKPNILFVSQTTGKDKNDNAYCGVGIRGKLTSDILQKSKKYNFVQCFTNGPEEVEQFITKYNPKMIIFNFHGTTTPWIYEGSIQHKYSHIPQAVIHYDLTQSGIDNLPPNGFCDIQYLITDDDTLKPTSHILIVPRSLPCDGLFINNGHDQNTVPTMNKIPKIGYQGFGFEHKGIRDLARVVQEEFDEAILRLHIPYSYYGDPNGDQARQRLFEVLNILTKPGIKLEISHNFMSDEEIVTWLHENDINCYFYWPQYECGVASSPDYAISAGKPIAITRSHQLRNMWDIQPPIFIEDTPLKTIMSYGIDPLKPLYTKYSHERLIHEYELICDKLINNHNI